MRQSPRRRGLLIRHLRRIAVRRHRARRSREAGGRRRDGRWRAHRRRGQRAAELARARPHLRRAALQPARADQRRQRREARARVVVRHRHHARPAGKPDRRRRHDVHHRHVERGVGARREDRQGTVEVRPGGAARVGPLPVLRCRQPRRRGLEGRGVRRHDRRPPRVARREDRREALGSQHHRPHQALQHHRRAARGEGQGADRQRRRRDGRARLSLGLRRRRPASSRGASTPCPATRRTASSIRNSRRPRRPGTASGGSAAVAARCGTRWPTTRNSTRCTSARAMARPGRATSARRAAATTCSCRRSSRSTPTPAG